MGAELYYHCIIIDSFAQPGVPKNSVYPSGHIPANAQGEMAAAAFAYPVQVKP